MEKTYIIGTVILLVFLSGIFAIEILVPKLYCVQKETTRYCSYSKDNLKDFVRYTSPGKTNTISRNVFNSFWKNKTGEDANITKILDIKIISAH